MLKNTNINRKATQKVAHALKGINKDVVYVGGAIVSFYIDDSAADDVRPTKDIDISLEIHSIKELEDFRQLLVERGFKQSHEDEVICRFRYDDVLVDVMSTRQIGWAPANRWFAPGFEQKFHIKIDDLEIYIMPLPYFLASKFDAFHDRGSKDPRTSHDFEDIVYLLNHTSDILNTIHRADQEVQKYLKEQFQRILNDKDWQEAIIGNLFFEEREERYKMILDKLNKIVEVI